MTCILHTGSFRSGTPYGVVQHLGGQQYAHRVAYVKHHGLALIDIKGKVVRHTCDNPPCINPEHLLLGTHSDNMKDMWSRGRGTNLPPRMANEDHPQCKISDVGVAQIRKLAAAGIPRKELQIMSGLSKTQIQRIVTGGSRQ